MIAFRIFECILFSTSTAIYYFHTKTDWNFMTLTPYPSVLDFWKIKFEKSSSTNWIFNLQKSISKLIFAGYTGSKNPVRNRLKIQFVELDFSKLIFQKSSTDQLILIGKNLKKDWPFFYESNDFFFNLIPKNAVFIR